MVAHAGARNVVVTDVNPFRLDLAKRMGATRAVDIRSEDLHDIQGELGMTEGFDVALEMSGSPSAMDDVVRSRSTEQTVALLGMAPGLYQSTGASSSSTCSISRGSTGGRCSRPGTR